MKFRINKTIELVQQMLDLGQVSCDLDQFTDRFSVLTAPEPGAALRSNRWGLEQLVAGGFAREREGRVILTDLVLARNSWKQDFTEHCEKT